jgi:hypothetical protein
MYLVCCGDPYCPNKARVQELENKIRHLESLLYRESEKYKPRRIALEEIEYRQTTNW